MHCRLNLLDIVHIELTQVFPSLDYLIVSLQKCSSNQVLFR